VLDDKAFMETPSRQYEPYADRDRPGVVRVPVITEKHKGMEAIIDADDLPLVQGKQWNWSPGKPANPMSGSVVLRMNGTPKPSLGRIILGITDPEQQISHRNGDRLTVGEKTWWYARARKWRWLASHRPRRWRGSSRIPTRIAPACGACR
jgi:hypothetical protein